MMANDSIGTKPNVSYLRLDDQDKQILLKPIRRRTMALVIIWLAVGFLLYFNFQAATPPWFTFGWPASFVLFVWYMVGSLIRDLTGGHKEVITGRITKKEKLETKFDDRKDYVSYFFHFGTEKLSVDMDTYGRFHENDTIEVQRPKYTGRIYFGIRKVG